MDVVRSTALQLSTTFLRLRPDCSVQPIAVDQTFWPRIMSGQLGGNVTLPSEDAAGRHELTLDTDGAYAVVPRGTWHTARVHRSSRMLFITPDEGTQNRPV